jgi:hypothetical protein
MHSLIAGHSFVYGIAKYWVGKEITIANSFIDTGKVLVDNPASAQRHMTYFRVAHLPIRQAHGEARGMNKCLGIIAPQLFPHWGIGAGNCVVFWIIAVAKAIEY